MSNLRSRPCLAIRAAQYRAVLESLHRSLAGDSTALELAKEHLAAVLSYFELSNGNPLQASAFPQCAALLRDGMAPASAVFVSGRVVLTAKHAVQNVPVGLLHVSLPLARIGDPAPNYKVADSRVSDIGDIAVLALALADPVLGVPPIRLADSFDFAKTDLRDKNSGLMVCGFGQGFLPDAPLQMLEGVKLDIQVPILPSTAAGGSAFNSQYEFIAGDPSGQGEIHNICISDSGGPAFSARDPQLLIGIVNRTVNNLDDCGNYRGAFYARIDAHAAWIRAKAIEMNVPLQ